MTWDESKHPRKPAGTPRGGEFAPLSLWTDGLLGKEVPHTSVPNGSDAFQYAVGRVTEDGQESVFRRRADERGTYGGWRWETDTPKLKSGAGLKLAIPPKFKPKK
jgi:hypothetical protein